MLTNNEQLMAREISYNDCLLANDRDYANEGGDILLESDRKFSLFKNAPNKKAFKKRN